MTAVDVREMHERSLSYGRMSEVLNIAKSTLAAWGKGRKLITETRETRKKPNEALRLFIRLLKEMKPTWGIRRVRAWVRKALEIPIGRKRVARILREEGLLCPRFKKRSHRKQKPMTEAKAPKQLFAMDQTQFMLVSGRALYLMVVLDIFTRTIVGWHLSTRCRTKEWLTALDNSLVAEFPEGVRGHDLILRTDNGCQPTSKAFLNTLDTLDITPEWTGYNSPKQNAHVERVIGTLKADWLWIEECENFDEAKVLVTRAVEEYNSEHPHSSLAFLSPNEYRRAWENGQVFINEQNELEITPIAA